MTVGLININTKEVAIYERDPFRSHTLSVRGSGALEVCKVVASGGSIAFEIIISPAVGFGKLAKGPIAGSVAVEVCMVVGSGGSVAVEIIILPAVGFGKVAEAVGLCWGRGPLEKKNHGSCQI